MTLMEVAVVLAVLAILALYGTIHTRTIQERALRIQCLSNLRVTGMAFRVWAGDHNDHYPMSVSQTNGGSSEFITGPNAWRHFQAMSNELSSPIFLFCPEESDRSRFRATNFGRISNSNLSFFVGIDADPTNAASLLCGDRNITNGNALKNSMLEATATARAGWTSSLHDGKGNLLFADGSVRRSDGADLPAVIAKTGLTTNRLQMPVTFP